MRAIAERDDVTVSYGAEPPGAAGPRVRLPLPARDLSETEAGLVRGAADSLALKLRYHDAAIHTRRAPAGETARAIFEGVEQARVEALGARRMVGVASNLATMLDERYRRQGYEHMAERTDTTLAEAVRLLTREALTQMPPPRSARKVVDLWRPFLEGRIARDLAELGRLITDQDAYAKATRQLLQDLDLDLGELEEGEQSENAEGESENSEENEGESEGGEGKASGAEGSLEGGVPEQDKEDGDEGGAEEVAGEMMPGAGDEDPGRPGRPGILPRRQGLNDDPAIYRAFTAEYDEVVEADALCDADELTRLRQLARSATGASAERHRPARQPAAAPAPGEADPRLGVRSRGRHSRCGAARPRRDEPGLSALLQAREGDRVPRHGGDPAHRQFRLDARPADHGRGDERRHSRAHPRALRRQGRDSRLHDAGLEGRAVARALDRRRQAAQSRPAQRSAPHRLQGGRRALAARAQESRPDAARGHPQGKHRRRGADLGA